MCAEFQVDRLSLSWSSMVPDKKTKQTTKNNNLKLIASLATAESAARVRTQADQYTACFTNELLQNVWKMDSIY